MVLIVFGVPGSFLMTNVILRYPKTSYCITSVIQLKTRQVLDSSPGIGSGFLSCEHTGLMVTAAFPCSAWNR